MNEDLSVFLDPETRGSLSPGNESELVSEEGIAYPVVKGIPRFVGSENYAQAFGSQWNDFPKTQLDSHTGLPITEERLERCFQGRLPDIRGRKVLEAGSGAGRFTEILLKYGARLHSFDFSLAVEANASNNGPHASLSLAQADIRRIPYPRASYDFVVCLGVIQHTPDPEESIRHLWEMVAPGGYLVIDHYRRKKRDLLPLPNKAYRAIIRRLPSRYQMNVVKSLTDFWFPIYWRFRDFPLVLSVLGKLSPLCFYYPGIALADRQMHYEWSLLDTHDATTDWYKHLRTADEIKGLLESIGAESVTVVNDGNGVEAFCTKPV